MPNCFSRLLGLLAALPVCLLCTAAQGQSAQTSVPLINPAANLSNALAEDTASNDEYQPVRTITSSTASNSKMLAVAWPVSRKRSLAVSLEYMKMASFYYKMPGQSEKPDWYFKSAPLTISIEQLLGDPEWRIIPVAGVGASVYMSKTRTRLAGPPESFDRQIGAGLGLQTTFGLKTRLTTGTFFLSQARYRIIDGFALTGSDKNYRFGLFDFAVGFGIDF